MTLPTTQNQKKSLVQKFAGKYHIDHTKLMSVLKATAFKQSSRDNEAPVEVTDEQMAALLIVADQYDLNPFTREIYAFPDKGKGIVPVVSVDGWTRIINSNPYMDGLEFKYSANPIKIDEDAKECPEWVECIVYRKDRSKTYVVREYLDECYRPAFKLRDGGKINGPWQTHTKRFLRHKALIQGARIAFGFAGIYDEDEARGITGNWSDAEVIDVRTEEVLDTAPFMLALEEHNIAFDDRLESYINLIAKQNRISPEKVKVESVSDMQNFLNHFNNWLPSTNKVQQTSPKSEQNTQKRQKQAAEMLTPEVQ